MDTNGFIPHILLPEPGGKVRYVKKKVLLTFLSKMCQNLSDNFFKIIFQFSSRQVVSLSIDTVRRSLMLRFVPHTIGLNAITREQYIEKGGTDLANRHFNPNPNDPVATAYINGTYVYMHKSSYFRELRQSY